MSSPIQIAVYITGHGYGHFTRTLNLLDLLSKTDEYSFHIRTTSRLQKDRLTYPLHPSVIQINAYHLDGKASLQSLQALDTSVAEREEACFLKENKIQIIISDAISLPCSIAHSMGIPSILVTNFTFDSIYQALLDNAPESVDKPTLQMKIDEMSRHYGLAHTVIRLPGAIHFPFSGPKIVDSPMHFRKAKLSRSETLAGLGLQSLESKKILLHSFGGHDSTESFEIPTLPEGWVCITQSFHAPPTFHKVGGDVYIPDLIVVSDAMLGKLGWGTCSEVIGNGYKPFIYVPRSEFNEEVGLLPWMESTHRRIVRLEVEKYESSAWLEAVDESQRLGERQVGQEDWEKNDAAMIRIFHETVENALHDSISIQS